MKENGTTIKQMVEENSGMQMGTFMRVNGRMTRLMVMEYTST